GRRAPRGARPPGSRTAGWRTPAHPARRSRAPRSSDSLDPGEAALVGVAALQLSALLRQLPNATPAELLRGRVPRREAERVRCGGVLPGARGAVPEPVEDPGEQEVGETHLRLEVDRLAEVHERGVVVAEVDQREPAQVEHLTAQG